MAFGEILLAGYSGQSRGGKMAPSCLLRQPITARDLVHLARSQSQPYNNNNNNNNNNNDDDDDDDDNNNNKLQLAGGKT